ncbi:hypothetical protein CLOP_g17884 [Closterium sp. NIES-67]|nr:hypothetical protein CLOP_g17884 [Closterium sp. NIES-67]
MDRDGGERGDTGLSDMGPGMGLGREGPSAQALMPPGAEVVEDDHLPADDQEVVLDSVVKVFAVGSSPNYRLPWQNKPQREVTGSGFVIMGRRILTSAHIVADQAFVLVRKHGSPKKYLAQVQAVAHECDLALLTFWAGLNPLPLGDVPQLQESVAVVGYPQGGDNISISMGVVSRVEPTKYAHSGAHLLAIQIDAAINPGNSGGPALVMTHVPVLADSSGTGESCSNNGSSSSNNSSSRDVTQSHRIQSQLQGTPGGRAGSGRQRSILEDEDDLPGFKGLDWGEEGGEGMMRLGREDGRGEREEEGEEERGIGGGWAEIEAERAAEEAAARAPVAMRVEYQAVGVAFQNLTGAENIGYIVPTPIIHRFLHDVALHHHHFRGFSSLGVSCQPLDNWQLREHLKLPRGATGVLVNAVQPMSESSRWLKKDDVLTAFDGVHIADDGSVLFRKRERLPFDYLVSLKGSGERARVSVYRGGQLMHFEITVDTLPPLVPAQQFDSAPSYFIFAGLVFMPLSQPYLHEYGPDWLHASPRRLCDLALRNLPEKPGQQIIILSRVLPDEVNSGYERLADLQVLKVNGVEVDNIQQLRDAVLETSGPFVRFDLEDGRIIAIDIAAARKSNAQILRRYRVPSASSWDLRQMADSHSHGGHSRF